MSKTAPMVPCVDAATRQAAAGQEGTALESIQTVVAEHDPLFHLLFERSLDAMVIADDDGDYIAVNDSACVLLGYERDCLLSISVGDLVSPSGASSAERYQEYLRDRREAGEFAFIRPDGETRNASYTAIQLAPGQHLSILRDITDATRAEQKITSTEKERAYVMASARCLLWYAEITDSDHPDQLYWDARFVDVEAAQKFLPLDIQPGESYQACCRRSRLPEDRDRCDRIGTAAIRAGKSYSQEFRCRTADGAIHWMHEDVCLETVVDGKRWKAFGVCTDVTERKQAEQASRELELRHRMLFETMTQGLVYQDAEGVLVDANPAAEHILGITLDKMCGRLSFDPRWRAQRKDGSAMPGHEHPPMLALKTGAIVRNAVMGIYNPDQDEIRWLVVDSIPQFRPGEEKPYQVYSLFADITERTKHVQEIESLNVRLRRSIQETHHRVKNNLQIVSALVDLQVAEAGESVPVSALARVGHHTRAMAAIHDLLTLEAKADVEIDSISTLAAMERLVPLLQSVTGGRPLRCHADDFRLPLNQGAALAVLSSELVSNAVKHGRGDIEIMLAQRGDTARLEVCDSGPGFPPDFDWRGAANTGLALIDSTGRYELRGSISFENRASGGARVSVTFPIQAAQAARTDGAN